MAGWLDIITGANPRPGYGVTLKDGDGPAELSSPVTIAKPVIDRGEMAVTCVLTTPSPDRQGDIVVPAGADLSEHRLNPLVLFHHGKAGHLPIGKAEDKYGNYTVRLMKGADGADRLVGTTYFAQNNEESGRFAASVFGLIDEDILRGVSVGFDPIIDDEDPKTHLTKAIESLGPSIRLERDALRFNKWRLLEYSHTPIGVNRDALTIAVHKALDGSREMHPILLKYLQPLATPRKTVVSVGAVPKVLKAFPPPGDDPTDTDPETVATPPESSDELPPDPAVDDAAPDDGANMGPQPTPTVRALLDAAQGAVDLADQVEVSLEQAEHIKGRKHAQGLAADLRKLAEKAKQKADEVTRELAGADKSDNDSDDTDDNDADDNDADDAGEGDEGDEGDESMERDDDGAIVTKAYPNWTPARWTRADLASARPVAPKVAAPTPAAAPPSAPEPNPVPVTKATDAEELETLRQENAELQAAMRNLLDDMKAVANRRRA